MIVAFPPGGQADLAARPVALALEKILGKSVVVDNRAGAGGMVGNAAVARAEPDGHTLLMALSSMMFLPEAERLYDRKPSYELDQLVPIARVLADPGVLGVRSDSPWKSVADLVADAKKRPGAISFSSSGNYGASHVPFEMFQQAAGIKLLHVPYRGGGPALTAFVGAQVDITAQAPGVINPHARDGKVRLLAHWGGKRTPELAGIPTMIELGYKDVEYYIWAGLFAPKGTPAPIVSRLRDAMREVDDQSAGDVGVREGRQPARLHGSAGVREVRRGRRQAADSRDQENRKTGREMKIGLFDHIEYGERPIAQLFDERLKFIEAADEAGFYCLHLAEHHQTPLNMVPVPGVFLGAVARATKRIRIGPLVYLLPLYSPLRMIDEICMLDHLSHGRAEIGVGRGVSPFELKYNKVDPDQSREIFIDAFRCISAGLITDKLTYQGPHYEYENVPIAMRPLQKPYPAFWYGSSGAEGSTWAGEEGLHFVTLGPTGFAKDNIDTFKAAFAKRGNARRSRRPSFPAASRSACSATSSSTRPTRRPSLGEARDGEPSRQHQLDPQPARRQRHRGAHEERARHELRGMRGGGHRDRRLAGDGAGRDRAADGGGRLQLSADLSLPRHHGVQRRAAFA